MPSMKHTTLNRRLFLQSAARVGAFAGATALLAACSQPKLVQPSATEDAPGTTPTALGTETRRLTDAHGHGGDRPCPGGDCTY